MSVRRTLRCGAAIVTMQCRVPRWLQVNFETPKGAAETLISQLRHPTVKRPSLLLLPPLMQYIADHSHSPFMCNQSSAQDNVYDGLRVFEHNWPPGLRTSPLVAEPDRARDALNVVGEDMCCFDGLGLDTGRRGQCGARRRSVMRDARYKMQDAHDGAMKLPRRIDQNRVEDRRQRPWAWVQTRTRTRI